MDQPRDIAGAGFPQMRLPHDVDWQDWDGQIPPPWQKPIMEVTNTGTIKVRPRLDEGTARIELYFGSVDEFVREFLIKVYRRQVGPGTSRRWSATWWKNAEAILRLESLWRSWESSRHDPAYGMAWWLKMYADHHMKELFDPDGPFTGSNDRNEPGRELPYKVPPHGLFPDVRIEE